jgi:hypothetical protein
MLQRRIPTLPIHRRGAAQRAWRFHQALARVRAAHARDEFAAANLLRDEHA